MAKRKSSKTRSKASSPSLASMKWHPVYLKGSFMLTAMIGFLISYYVVYRQLGSIDYGITFMFIFTLMFIASIISMTKAPAPMSEAR